MANYRVLVHYDPERSVFIARAPELEHCSGEGASRGEALARVEEEIDAQLRNMREHGVGAPAPVDEAADEGNEITLKVSRGLRRELSYQARIEGVELPQLVGEMLATGLELRRGRSRRPQSAQAPGDGPDATRRDDRGPRDDRRYRSNERGGGGRYHAIMEDRATFLEYVRGLESGGPPGRGPGGGGGRRRGRGRFGGGGEGGGEGGGGSDGSDGPGGEGQK